MDMYKKREMRKNKKEDVNKSLPSTSINWYPGHMAKTKREISERINLIDIVYEVIDARMPISSKVKDLDSIIKDKPRILIVTKYDLCDTIITDSILKQYAELYPVLKVDLKSNKDNINKEIISLTENILQKLQERRDNQGLIKQSYRALVAGAPNVGKSTLINRLAGRNVTKTGNKAGITKSLNWIVVNKKLELLDTPGILWPKIDNDQIGYNLASLASINEDILNKEDISRYILTFLYNNYPNILEERYDIKILDVNNLTDVYEKIGIQRGALLKGNIVDFDKVYNIIINDLKEGKIKNVTLDVE